MTGVDVTILDDCVISNEFSSLKILFVACLSLIIESGMIRKRDGDDACSTCITGERISALFATCEDDG
jgi:hypothetical protein